MKRFKKTLLFTFLFSLCACTPPKPEPTVSPTKEPSLFLKMDENTQLTVDETNYSETTINNYEIGFSKVEESEEGLIKLTDRGVIINKTKIDGILRLEINFSSLSEATLYYGDYFLSFTNSVKLKEQNTINIASYCSYFVIQSVGESIVKDITIGYDKDSVEEDEELPTFVINTENHASVTSRHSYVNCEISYHNPENEEESFDNAPATIKVRGNSTTLFPKFGYRLKFDEKQSFFGLKSNKSWALLADYLDGSKMHNYSALSFAEMVRKNTGTFCVTSHHVRYYLNGKDMGLFLLCEHINENKGRLDIKQDNLWEIEPENINFYVERDFGPAHDYYDVEGEDYFFFNNPDNYPSSNSKIEQYVFALKYPEKEDFYEELEDGSINEHTQEFQTFFNYVKDYISECALSLANYVKNQSYYSQITDKVDLDSLALFSITDQMFCESDHSQKSFKMYRRNGGKLEFGPNWDYDSCVDSMFYSGSYVLNPYEPYSPNKKGAYYPNCKSTWFGEDWGYSLFKDNINGVKHFKKIWKNISKDMIKEYLNAQLLEMKYIANMLKIDTSIWMDNAYHCVFDNLTFHYKWISTESYYLKDYFS